MSVVELLSSLVKKDIRLWLEGENLRFSAPEGAFTPEIRDQIVAAKPQIIEFLKQAQKLKKQGIEPAKREGNLPVSYSQQRLWLLDQINPGDTTYNIPAAFRILGDINPDLLEKAFAALVERHESLRTTFADDEGQPIQVIQPFTHWQLPVEDLSALPEAEREARLQAAVNYESCTPFDLASGPLFRARLLILQQGAGHNEYALIACMHHIISDAWSMEVLVKEMAAFYIAAATSTKAPLAPLPIQYADYAIWQRQYLDDEQFKEDLAYWEKQLKGAPPVLDIPTDFPRPELLKSEGATYKFQFPEALSKRMDAFCKEQDITPFMLTLGAWQLLLGRYANSTDVVVGAPVAGRDRAETQELIGFFVNLLLFRLPLSGRPTVKSFYQRVKEMVLGGFNHQEVPIDILLQSMDVERQPGYPPLAQAAFQLLVQEGAGSGGPSFGAGPLEIEPIRGENNSARMDLTLGVMKTDKGYQGGLEYNTQLFSEHTIANLMDQYQFLIGALMADTEQVVTEIRLFDDSFLLEHMGLDGNAVELAPLNANQRVMLIDQLAHPDTKQNAYGIVADLPAPLDLALLEQALQAVSDATPMLRAGVKQCDVPAADEAYFVIAKHKPIVLHRHSVKGLTANEQQLAIDALMHRSFDIFNEDLVHYHWVEKSNAQAVLVLGCHHMVLDGAATFAHMGKVLQAYGELQQGKPLQLASDIDYQAYAQWEKIHGNTAAIYDFWKAKLGDTEALNFTRPRPGFYQAADATRTADNCIVRLNLDSATVTSIREFIAQQGLSVPAYFRTLYGLMLMNYCRAENSFSIFDFYGNRRQVSAQAVGCFYQQHPVIFEQRHFAANTALSEWFDAALAFNQLVKDKRVIAISDQRALASLGPALFMFNFYNFTTRETIAGQSVTPYMSAPRVDQGVQFIVRDGGNRIELELRYDPRVFEDCQFLPRLQHISEQITSGEATVVGDLAYLSAGELGRLHHWSQVEERHSLTSGTIVDWFYEEVAQSADRVAIVAGERTMTYGELNEYSNRIAHWLRQQGIDANQRVGLCFERSADFAAAVWGVLKAGGAYIPMDAGYPAERLQYIVEDSCAAVILTQQKVAHVMPATQATLCVIDQENSPIANQSSSNLETRPQPQDQIYVIYTSGSTGKPKGAQVTHQGEANLQRWYLNDLKFSADSVALLVSAIGFDLTQKNLFASLLRGGKLVIPEMDLFDEQVLLQAIEQHQVTLVNCAPSAFYPLVQSAALASYQPLQSLRYVVLGGEPIQLQLLEQWLASEHCQAQLVNSYGPTECTDVVSYHVLDQIMLGERLIPIGRPIEGAQLMVLNELNQQVIPGLVGELCVAGIPVGLGYINQPDLTASVFQDNPFGDGKLYRTGDLVRYLPDGAIEYIGRKDFQIKLRGLRIELGEIETALKALPGVNDGLVLLRNEQLIGYVVTEQGDDVLGWREELALHLPDYMVPAALVVLAEWPLTPNGKVDRKALPEPDTQSGQNYVAPRNDVERLLVQIWQQVLELEQVGVMDNLFDIGGNSLLATRILSRVRRAFAVDVSVRELFQAPNVAGLAKTIQRCQRIGDIPSLKPQTRGAKIPLSFAQQRLWLLDQLDPGNSAYNMPAAVRLSGDVQPRLLEKVFLAIIERHDVFRTHFAMVDDEPVQVIADRVDYHLPITDLSHLQADEQEAEVHSQVVAEAAQPFDLATGPLLRSRLLKLADNDYVLLANKHHIISDGWSMGILMQEIAALYHAFQQGKPSPLPELPLQYADFAIWQRGWLQGEVLQKQIDYWKTKLADVPVLELATDYPRPAKPDQRGALVEFTLSEKLTRQLGALSQQNSSTTYITLLAAFQTLLYRYTNQHDIVVGSPIANRNWSELEPIIGFFVNTLAFRTQLDPKASFKDLLYRVEQTALEAYDHQDIPFERLVDELGVERSLTHTPVFQVLFTFQNIGESKALSLPGLTLTPIEAEANDAKFDLSLNMGVNPQGRLAGVFAYRVALYREDTIRQLIQHFQTLLQAIVDHPDTPLAQLPLLSQAEVEQQLTTWNQTEATYDRNTTMQQLIEAQCLRTPDAVAIRCGDTSLTYQQLDAQASAIASSLIAQGVKPGDKVGLCFDRHLHVMSAIFAILKAGGTYVPLDASYPEGRIRYIVEDAAIQLVVSRAALIGRLPQGQWQCLAVEDCLGQPVESQPSVAPDPERLLYMIYTSGSTGRPKGTGAYQYSEVNLQHWYCRDYGLNPQDNVMLMSALGFDLTQKNLFGPLIQGATLTIPDFQEFDPQLLLETIHHHEVTWINCAPSAFYPLVDDQDQWYKLASLKHLFLGGEPINLPRLRAWLNFSGCKLINSYGPTECTDIAAVHAVNLQEDLHYPVLPIGRPIDNVRLYILGDHNELMPVGGAAELCIGGDSVGPGYLNNQELTEQVFIQNPFTEEKDILYRTGDLVRYRPDGAIEYLGRRDHQIKLRGFRIEVEEIKAVINEFNGVTDSLVAVEKTPAGEILFAWVVTSAQNADQENAWLDSLKQHAANMLPSHMLPGAWFVLTRFPLTPNGKVDRKALPKDVSVDESSRAPATSTEICVAEVWQAVLGTESVGADQDFFQLGGHSLLATQVISRLKKHYGVDIPLRRLFESPTVENLACVIDELLAQGDQSQVPPLQQLSRSERLPLSFVQQQLWLLDQLDPGTAAYNMPVLLELGGELDVDILNQALSVVVSRHETLRSNFVIQNDEPVVVIHEPRDWQIAVIDLSDQSPADQHEAIQAYIDKETGTGFDLTKDALLRTTLLRCHKDGQPQRWVFVGVMHHIISDGWSMDVLVRELAASYIALKAGQQPQLPTLAYQYVDYAAWQRHWLQGEELEKQIAYWRKELDNEFAVLDLPTDFPRPAVQTIHGASATARVDSKTIAALTGVAKQEGATLFMALLAAFDLLLHRYSGQQGFNIGIPIAGRVREEVEPMIGMFINTAVISTDFAALNTYRDLLLQVKDKSLGAFSHQALPFEKIVEELRPKRDLSRTPYFQVFFNLLNLPESDQDLSGLSIKPLFSEDHETHAKFDLNLYAKETPEGVQLNLVYNTDLFTPQSANNLLNQFVHLLQQVGHAPEQDLLAFHLSADAADTRPDPSAALPLKSWQHPLDALASHAQSLAAKLAVKDTNQALTYQDLDQASTLLAAKLADQGVAPGDTVAIYAQRNANLVVSLLAVLKAGAVFTMYDAAYPMERLKHYQTINKANVLIDTGYQANATEAFNAFTNETGLKVMHCEIADLKGTTSYVPVSADCDARAYIAYTSGTTGEPKAISGSLAPVAHFIDWYQQTYELSAEDRFSMLSGLAHDPLLRDIFTPLTLGASLHIPDAAWYADPHELTSWLAQEGISVMHLTPAMAQLITGVADWRGEDPLPEIYQLTSLRYAVFGGDRLTAAAVNGITAYAGNATCINFYGATETPQAMACFTVADMADCHPNQWVPVGKGIDASQLLILNESGKLAEIGEVGEIVIRSPYLSEGYLNPLEDSPFRRNPLSDIDGDTCYFTGDKGRYLPDGSVHFLGRIDQQIKIRGYRVEPLEIQHELNHYAGIKTSVVVDGVDQRGDLCLHAYLVLEAGVEDIDRDALRRKLAQVLPDYMIPASFTLIDTVPLTPNGKLHRAALPEPAAQISQQAYVAPETEVEKEIAAIWQTILKIEQIGIHDDFFALGGHSLLATQIVSRVREKYNVEFPLRALFQSSTVKGMADYIETTLWARGDSDPEGGDLEDDDMEEFEI